MTSQKKQHRAVAVRLELAAWEKLREIAEAETRTVANVVKIAVAEFLERRESD